MPRLSRSQPLDRSHRQSGNGATADRASAGAADQRDVTARSYPLRRGDLVGRVGEAPGLLADRGVVQGVYDDDGDEGVGDSDVGADVGVDDDADVDADVNDDMPVSDERNVGDGAGRADDRGRTAWDGGSVDNGPSPPANGMEWDDDLDDLDDHMNDDVGGGDRGDDRRGWHDAADGDDSDDDSLYGDGEGDDENGGLSV